MENQAPVSMLPPIHILGSRPLSIQDAFSIYWDKYFGFYFPHFSILAKTIKKLRMEGERAIIVCPLWPFPIGL